MRYICAQPANQYYGWQINVMIHSFIKNGVNPNHVDIVLANNIPELDYYKQLEIKYPNVNFYYYDDTRVDKFYVSSIRPHILAKHFELYSNFTFFLNHFSKFLPIFIYKDAVDGWFPNNK